MANIDIAERLFVYAREKQQKDLANNLIKKEDVIDFSSADFNSFNQEISNMIGGLDNEQINMFVHLLQTKIDHNITDVITPGEKGFSLNVVSISSTIKQVQNQSKSDNKVAPPIEQNTETKEATEKAEKALNTFEALPLDRKILIGKLKDIEELYKQNNVPQIFINFYLSSFEDKYINFDSASDEDKAVIHDTSSKIAKQQLFGDSEVDVDYVKDVLRSLGVSDKEIEQLYANINDGMYTDILINELLGQIVHGNLKTRGNNLTIDPKALETYTDLAFTDISQDSPLYSLKKYFAIDKVQEVTNMLEQDPKYKEGLIQSKKYQYATNSPNDIYYNKVESKQELKLKFCSMLRNIITFPGDLPDVIEGKIEELIDENIIYNENLQTFEFKDNVNLEKIRQSFTIDYKSNPELQEIIERDGLDIEGSSTHLERFFNLLPDAMSKVVEKSMFSTKAINDLMYTEEDLKSIRPLLNKFSKTDFNISNSLLCSILNHSVQRESLYTHVNVEKILQSIATESKDFALDASNYEFNSSLLTAELNNITLARSKQISNQLPYYDYEDNSNFDINQFTSYDIKYHDVRSQLGERTDKIKLTKTYKKLFPSNVALDNGFLFDFDAQLIKMANLSSKSQIEIYSDPAKDSDFMTLCSALAFLYRENGKDISSTIDKSQQEKNLEILKNRFLENFDKSTMDLITVDNMAPIVNALIENKVPPTATALSNHIDMTRMSKYEELFGEKKGNVTVDLAHPGFLTPETYKHYNESLKEHPTEKDPPNIDISQAEHSKEDNHPIEQKKPRGLFGFVSSFINKFKNTDKESGIFNRFKDSFNYARNSVADYLDTNNGINDKTEDFKPNQSTNLNQPAELDSFSQSLRNEYADTSQNKTNNDGKVSYKGQEKSSDGRANSDDHDEMDI